MLILHIGLHKTATTYLQRAVFPYWSGVSYYGRNAMELPNRSAADLLREAPHLGPGAALRSNESLSGSLKNSYLPGRSWMANFRAQLDRLSSLRPAGVELGVMVSFRRYDRWARSIYRHYLKYGGVDSPEEFFGVRPGSVATLAAEDLLLMPRIHAIEEAFGVTPFCFFLEELRKSPQQLGREMAAFAGTDVLPHFPAVSMNVGVSAGEARLLTTLNRATVNRGCRRRGSIRRISRRAHRLVTAISKRRAKLGVADPGAAIRFSRSLRRRLDEVCHDDYESALAYAETSRRSAQEAVSDN